MNAMVDPIAERRVRGAAAPLHAFMVPTQVLLNEDNDAGDATLASLYDKAKAQQWNAARDLDWDVAAPEGNPLAMPDGTIAIHGSKVWQGMDEATRAEVRHDIQSWNLSQVLYGEQAALICAARLAQAESGVDMKLAAASQVIDEARHLEAYGRLARLRLQHTFAISSPLRTLFGNIVSESRPDFTCLGMQILVEGMALSLFQNLRAYTADPLFKQLLTLVLRDEARHFALGKLALETSCAQLTAPERAEREEFICESALRLHEHTCANEIWASVGLTRAQRKELVHDSAVSQNLRRSVFRRLVPTVRDMGLLGAKARQVFGELGMLEYAAFPAAA
jgi:hypothetical protein